MSYYRYQLSSYTGRQKLIFWTTSDETSITIDNSIIQKMHPHRLYTLRLQTKRTKDKWWSPSIDLFIMKKGGKPVLLGFKRRYNR